jgi:hypothetical protein
MRFTLIATSLIAAVAAQYGAPAAAGGDETCSAMVTVTVTEYVSPISPYIPTSSQPSPNPTYEIEINNHQNRMPRTHPHRALGFLGILPSHFCRRSLRHAHRQRHSARP